MAGGTETVIIGLEKLCLSNAAETSAVEIQRLEAIGLLLLEWDADLLEGFFDDITEISSDELHVTNHVGVLDDGLVKAWEVLKSAGSDLSRKVDYLSKPFVTKLSQGNYPELRSKLAELVDGNGTEAEFLDNFGNISNWGINHLENTGSSLIDFWRVNRNSLSGYHGRRHAIWPSNASSISDPKTRELVELLNVHGDNLHNGTYPLSLGCHLRYA